MDEASQKMGETKATMDSGKVESGKKYQLSPATKLRNMQDIVSKMKDR